MVLTKEAFVLYKNFKKICIVWCFLLEKKNTKYAIYRVYTWSTHNAQEKWKVLDKLFNWLVGKCDLSCMGINYESMIEGSLVIWNRVANVSPVSFPFVFIM